MAEAEKRENSVLFSLRELQRIEEERVTEEDAESQRREEERIRAKMEAERAEREAEEMRVRAERDEAKRALDEVEGRQREQHLRLQETETRARIEAQAKLEQERLSHEMHIRRTEAENTRPKWLIGVAAILVLLVGGLGYWLYTQQQEKNKEKEEARIALEEKEHALAKAARENEQLQEDIEALSDQIDEAQQEFAAAVESQDADRQKAAQAKLDRLRGEQKSKKTRYNSNTKSTKTGGNDGTIQVNSSTPLGDLKRHK